MKRISFALFTALICFGISINILAQTPEALKPTVITGDVVTVTAELIELKTATGQIKVNLSETTEFKRVSPTNPSLRAAIPVLAAEVGVGDKVMVTGILSADKLSIPARAVYVMTQSDIAQRNKSETERWTVRGISGRVASVNPETKQVTIEVRGLMGTTSTVISPKENVIVKRYAPNSIKYNEAIVSALSDIQAGEMLRATGDRSADGRSFIAEEIITGAFQTVAGTVKSIDAANNQITITDIQSNEEKIVSLGSATTLKRFPEDMAQRMAAMQGGQPGGAPTAPGAGGPPQRPAGQPGAQPTPGAAGQPGAGGPNGRGGMGGRGGIDEMLERFPSISAGDLKVGEMVAISSSKNGDNKNLTAIKLLAGVEPFIRAAQASGQMQRGGRGSQSGGFTIPGLDGIEGF